MHGENSGGRDVAGGGGELLFSFLLLVYQIFLCSKLLAGKELRYSLDCLVQIRMILIMRIFLLQSASRQGPKNDSKGARFAH